MLPTPAALRSIASALSVAALAGCSYVPSLDFSGWGRTEEPVAEVVPPPERPIEPRLETRRFDGVSGDQEVLGDVQVVRAREENTFVQIAREFNVGYDELRLANPDVDVWLPGEATPVVLPTMSVVPAVPREGIVLNLPSMRLMYFRPETVEGEAVDTLSVTTHPIGIGRQGWATPTGRAEVTQKARDPVWYPPASVRAEHAELGDPLPSIVEAGPDNPLGHFAIGLSMPGYLSHGTNKPAGVGMRVSHGCIRLYPEDIEALFDEVPSGLPVNIIDEPVLAGWRDGELYLEVHEPLAEDERDLQAQAFRVIDAAFQRAELDPKPLNKELVARIVSEQRGIPYPIYRPELDIDAYVAGARLIENPIEPAEPEATAQADVPADEEHIELN
jgi:L,D-transpeptidase ErfK/SrfK